APLIVTVVNVVNTSVSTTFKSMTLSPGPPVTSISVIVLQSKGPPVGSTPLTFTSPATSHVTVIGSAPSLATVNTPAVTVEVTAARSVWGKKQATNAPINRL